MRRIVLWIATLLVTFAVGVGVHRSVPHYSETTTLSVPKVQDVPAAIVKPAVEAVPAVIPVEPLPESVESRIILDYDDETFYPNGTYYILGPRPKEFAEFQSFETDYSEYVNDQPVGYISINTKAGGGTFDSHSAVFGFVNPRRIVFVTSMDPKTEFEYLFDGEFIRSDFDVVANKDEAVVRGTLTKMKRGQKIAERVLSFSMVQHGC